MANGTRLMSLATSVLDDVISSKENNTDDFFIDVPGTLWRCGGPRFDQSRIRPNLGPRR